MKRYIKLYATKPPGKSIVVEDLDNRPAIAAGDIPEAKWDVERADGTLVKMTGQQILDQVTGGTPGTGSSGRPAEIEIEDTADGIRIRGKSGDATEFGPWFTVRDGRDGAAGRPAEIQIEDITGGIRVRGKSGSAAEFGEWHTVRDGRDGRDATGGTISSGFQDVYAPGGKVIALGGKVIALPVPLRTPTFELEADIRSILLSILPNVDDPTIGYEYQLRRRNIRDTGWTNPHKWVNLATRLRNRITTYNDFVRLRGGQEYQIRIRSYKLYNRSEPTAYQSVTPRSPMGEVLTLGGNIPTVGSKAIVFGS